MSTQTPGGSSRESQGVLVRFRALLREDQLVLGGLAVLLGAMVGAGVCLFREAIGLVQSLIYGGGHEYLATLARETSPWVVVLGPALGGLVVGVLYRYAMPGREPLGVAHVIEDMALRGGAMDGRKGLMAALGSALSLGVGASVGREGPAVHLGATLCALVAGRLRLGKRMARTLLGCGAAAAVAASFNTPIAGALFANEVIIGHYALSAFAPVVVASVAGTVVSRIWFGHESVFTLPSMTLTSYWEFPAFAGLGVVAALAAVVFMRGIFLSASLAHRSRLPRPLRPMVAGFAVGLMALWLPEVLGVGYETTDHALRGGYDLQVLVTVAAAKMLATVVCLGWGFGGGVFSPSLALGALIGAAYGIAATSVFPALSSGETAYALIGMGAMAAAVLGAPISTTLIIFEFTGDYELTIGVVVAVVIATGVVQRLIGRDSFFHWQLARRGLRVRASVDAIRPPAVPLSDLPCHPCPRVPEDAPWEEVAHAMRTAPGGQVYTVNGDGAVRGVITASDLESRLGGRGTVSALDLARPDPPVVTPTDSLDQALALLAEEGGETLALVEDREGRRILGIVREADLLRAHNRSLIEAFAGDHLGGR